MSQIGENQNEPQCPALVQNSRLTAGPNAGELVESLAKTAAGSSNHGQLQVEPRASALQDQIPCP